MLRVKSLPGLAAALTLTVLCLLAPAGTMAAAGCTIVGSPGADRLTGTGGADVICGRGGADVVHGRGGADRLLGGGGGDRLFGDSGRDTLLGGPGDDRLAGGPGRDVLAGGAGSNLCPGSVRLDRVSHCRVAAARRAPSLRPSYPLSPYAEPPDTAPPRLLFAGLGPVVADASAGPLELSVYAAAWDEYDTDFAGSDVASVTARVVGPGGFQRDVPLAQRTEDWSQFEATTVVADPQPGFYRLESVALTDVRGNSGVSTQPQFGEGFGPGTEVYAGPDEEGPELLDFTISPAVVDTSDGPATVTMSAHVADPLAGARQVGPSFDIPSQEPSKFFGPGRYGYGMQLTEGDVHDGIWSVQVELPRYAAPGSYDIGRFDLYDRVGEYRHFEREDLEAAGFPVSFEVAPPGDSQPPQIDHLGIGRPVVHAAAGDDEVVFFLELSDDLSGVEAEDYFSYINVIFASTVGPPPWFNAMTSLRFSGTDLHGVWKVSGELPADAPTGEYHVTRIELTDRAGNMAVLEDKALTDTGWDLTFENLP